MDWNQAYEKGDFKNWDFGSASPELVTLLAVRGLPETGSRALDIGCGGGWDSIFLAQCGFDVTGVDVSPTALRLAAERAKEAGPVVFENSVANESFVDGTYCEEW